MHDAFASIGSEGIVYEMIETEMREFTTPSGKYPAMMVLYAYLKQIAISTIVDKKPVMDFSKRFLLQWDNLNRVYGDPVHKRFRLKKNEAPTRHQIILDYCINISILKPRKTIAEDPRTQLLETTSRMEGNNGRVFWGIFINRFWGNTS